MLPDEYWMRRLLFSLFSRGEGENYGWMWLDVGFIFLSSLSAG